MPTIPEAQPWSGTAWEAHKRRYVATDPGGSLTVSGRYNRGLDRFPDDRAWPALYMGLSDGTCLGEVLRHLLLHPELLSQLNDYRISELHVTLEAVIDFRGVPVPGLLHESDYHEGQRLAAEAIARGVEGILVPSITGLGDNLVVFPNRLRPGSSMRMVGFRDELRLYPER